MSIIDKINASPPNPARCEPHGDCRASEPGSGKPLYEAPGGVSGNDYQILARIDALANAVPIALSKDGAHVFVLMELPGEVYDELLARQDADADLEDDNADACPVEDLSGEGEIGWPNEMADQTACGVGFDGEASLGSLSGRMNQTHWAERGDWRATADAEDEHDGREVDDEDCCGAGDDGGHIPNDGRPGSEEDAEPDEDREPDAADAEPDNPAARQRFIRARRSRKPAERHWFRRHSYLTINEPVRQIAGMQMMRRVAPGLYQDSRGNCVRAKFVPVPKG